MKFANEVCQRVCVCVCVQGALPAAPVSAAAEEGKGRMSNNIYVIPGASHPVSIRDAAYYCVGEVLSGIDGGRAKVKDVIDKINKIFLTHNPGGWQTTNPQKRAKDGGFTTSALRRIGKAAPPANPGRWAMKPTFCADDNELVFIHPASSDNAVAAESDGDDDEISDIDQ